jgi:hypothetical protein
LRIILRLIGDHFGRLRIILRLIGDHFLRLGIILAQNAKIIRTRIERVCWQFEEFLNAKNRRSAISGDWGSFWAIALH